jgi:prophage regulatory protein
MRHIAKRLSARERSNLRPLMPTGGRSLAKHIRGVGLFLPLCVAKERSNVAKRILRLKDVQEKTGLKHSAIYERVLKGRFPKQFRLGAKAVGWLEEEIDAWIDTQVAARDAGKAA